MPQYNVPTTIRQEKGQDISGACGQLVIQASQKQSVEGAAAAQSGGCGAGKGHSVAAAPTRDIEDLRA